MTPTHEVISAFLDDEPFDTADLAAALADPAGRELLLDLISLRHVAQPEEAASLIGVGRRSRRPVRLALAAAALLVALSGGYAIGWQRAANVSLRPPQPTQVINLSETKWQEIPGGTR